MDLAKFVALLQQRALYFTRADRFSDPFEGASGLSSRESEWDNFYLDFFRNSVVTPPPGHPIPNLAAGEIEAQAQMLLSQIKAATAEAKSEMVSCWHGGEGESEALWRLYCPPSTLGVAINTTVGNLWEAFPDGEDVVIGKVQYVDFKRSFASPQRERIFQKRQSLSHESEIRIVLWHRREEATGGTAVSCDLSKLISKVVISPFAPAWCTDVLSGIIARYEHSLTLERSELLDSPF